MTARLERYRRMRDFRRTPEPRGKTAPTRRHHYYIQRHDATRLHYDLRLELDGVLKSWAVPKGPSLDPQVKRLAVEVEDHPLEYGEFEGTIPEKQYGAGDVLLWDKGEWTPEDDDPGAALRKGRLHFELRGRKLSGRWVLTRTASSEKKPTWLLIKRHDEAADPDTDIIAERPESVKRESAPPRFVAPMLATLVDQPPGGGDWVYEVKHDGYRMLARLAEGKVTLSTRTGRDWTAKLPQLAAALEKMGLEDSLLDGEIVVPGPDGRSNFQALQNAFDAGNDANIVYYVFDAPYLRGEDLRRLPLADRKKRLEGAIEFRGAVRYSEDLEGDAAEVLAHACKLKLEGLIGKQARSPYVSGRSRSWIKLKCRQRQDFVIGGYTAPGGSRSGFGALLVGFHDAKGKLRYAGKVGTGFNDALLSSLSRKFVSLRRKDTPFADPPREKGVTWLQPKLVAEVAYAERTNEGILRQAAFMGLRRDLPAKNVAEEKAEKTLKITHPERLVWKEEKLTKLDLAHYYEAVADYILPHLKDRPLTLVRCPGGVEGKCFYQRHLAGRSEYMHLDSIEGILRAVQNNAVEFHTWGARVPDIKHPDRITMDLDPGEGITWAKLADAARLTRTLLDELGLRSFLKTTGGKGLHVVAPIQPGRGWDEVKEFTRLLAVMLTRAQPGRFIDKMSKDKREGKIYVDYLRNAETASAVAAFSARARPGAGVSVPLAWDELGKADLRGRFTILTVPRRLKQRRADPWAGYASTRQSITERMLRAVAGSR